MDSENANGRVRINVVFSKEINDMLESIARRKGKTKSEILRDAISLEKWFNDVLDEGGHVLVERDGKIREVLPLG